MPSRSRLYALSASVLVLALFSGGLLGSASAQPTTITAYRSQSAVTIDGSVSPGEWNDTQTMTDPASGMTFAIKQNGTGLLFLMIWNESSSYCSDSACFGGIELGHTNNTSPMGSPSTPTIMILASPSFKNGVDEFISTGESTPVSVESKGYSTQSVCALKLVQTQYTAECYRPFKLTNASPYDFELAPGSTVEIAFAVGEFSKPGLHGATNMDSYILSISNATYSSTQSATSTSSQQQTTPAAPDVLYYWLELAVIVVGFTLFLLIILLRYERS